MIQLIKDQLTAAGTDTYTSALVTKYTSLQKGVYVVTFTNANTGAATLNVDGLGAVDLVDLSGSPLAAGAIVAGRTFFCVYDGVDFIFYGAQALPVDNHYVDSTGVYKGGVLTIGTPNTTFSISDGNGAVTDNDTGTNTYTPVSWTGKTNITATYIASGLVSYVAIDSTGAVIQQLAPFSQTQSRSLILLGSLIHTNLTNLDAVNNFQDVILSPANMVHDISHSLGVFNITGNLFSANGANLNLNKSVGSVYSVGSNWANDPLNPSQVTLASLAALTFQYRFQNGTNGATGIAVNPNIYDVAGVSTAVPSSKYTIQRIYSFVSNNVKIQPGQAFYQTLAEAKASVQTEIFTTEPSILQNGLLRGFLVVKQGATSLLNTSDAFFYEASKFGGQQGIGGQSVSTLQNAYDNSISPEILTDSTRGAVTIKRGSAADTDNIIEGQNGAGTTTFSITGNGVITGVGTNLTGTASGLTAGTVTTNANLTGAITSVGNATSLGSFTSAQLATALTDETGTGVAVFANTPTLITPVLGSASATTLLMAGEPTLALQVATKSYVDNLINGLKFKQDVVAASTANVNIASSPSTLDTVTLVALDRVLLKNQSTASENGIYQFNGAASALTRTLDADTGSELVAATIPVRGGTTNQDTWWTITNDAITIGVTSITLTQTGGAGTYVAGTGLGLAGNVFSINSTVATLTGSQVLTNKTLTTPTINGGTSYFDSLSYVANAGWKVRIMSTDAMTADRTLIIQMNNGSRVFNIAGNLDLANNLVTLGGGAITFNAAGTTNVTLPSTGTLYGTASGSITSAQLALSLTDETGTGANVFATSPTLVTPALGTPSALVGTNITGTAAGLTAGTVTTNANLTGHITSVGNATSLGSFTSAQLATALTDETGSGSAVFGTSPTITGGSITMLTSFGVKSTASAFSMKIANVTALTADRTLTIDIGDAARGVNFLGGVVTFNNSFTTGSVPITLNGLNTTVVTLPLTGTLYGTESGSITSAQLAASLTNETGTGSVVFGTSPTITTSLVAGSASMSLFNTVATTISAFAVASQLDVANLTTTQAVNIACGITATANNKTVNIGTNGAAGSTTIISVGTATAATTTTIYLNGDVINLSGKSSTFTGHNINVGSDASYDMWHRGTGAGLTRIANGTTGQALVATTGAAPAFAFVVPRQTNLTSSSTPTPNLDNEDQLNVTALAVGATIGAPTGTFAGARKLVIRIKDNGTSQTLAYNAIFKVIGVILPVATVINKTIYLGCIYNAADTKWDVVAYQLEV